MPFHSVANSMKAYSKNNLTNEKVAFNCLLSRKRRVTENGFEYELKDSGYLQTVTPASVAVISTVALHNVLRWKPRDSYTPKGRWSSKQWIIVARRTTWKYFFKQHNWSVESSFKKTKSKCQKNSSIIAGVCQNKFSFVFEDSTRLIEFWNCTDENLLSPCKIKPSLLSNQKMSKSLYLTTKL